MTARDKGWFLLWLAMPVLCGDFIYYEILGNTGSAPLWIDKAFFLAMFGVCYLGLAKIEDWIDKRQEKSQ